MDGHPLASIPPLTLQEDVNRHDINPGDIVSNWLAALDKRPQNGLSTDLPDLFIEDSWWRDFVGLSWDIATKHGLGSIGEYLNTSTTGFGNLEVTKAGGLQPALVDMHGMIWVQGGFTFKTRDGSGQGLVRLINVSKTQWKAWTVFTQLERLNSQDEIDRQRLRQDYTQTRLSNGVNGGKEEPQVLIIGAGQAGLTLAAQLKHMGVKALLVDRLPRLGDFWRSRYETVRTHTPIYTDHYPFLKFPTTWPRWLERDKIADWMEHYGQIMGLDYILSTTVQSIDYDETSRVYTVEVENADGKHTFRPRHLVLATGVFANTPIIPEIPGKETFGGEVYHSMHHKGARHVGPSLSQKRIVIVGSGTSAHDIAQDFVNSGAQAVSIVQRHAIFSLSAKAAEDAYFSLWTQPGVSTEEADIIANSFPTAVVRTLNIGQTAMMEEHDKDLLEGLERMGMQIKKSKKAGYGFIDHLIVRTGHFYVDQGASPMIVDGRIKIHHCEEGVKEFVPDGVVLGDGKQVDADIVVLATGYHRNVLTVKELMGDKVADVVGDLGYMDSEQERIGWWRPTGWPGLWYMTGSFVWCRQYSPVLALQITALEQGLNPEYWEQKKRNNKGLGTIPR
ncbi:hypothetical protein G647_04502 [Cladophialophora carrionii CBS 160.54]|uniref:FAD/NAD(P)-binding domain-containing protein n=1 Tax=Cladophialophora carrionii CBS 160.54 TaxID=1279043 RepID=V9DE54_9EURO|nr:uncharacterized protein G647_04502 [Cladophialophora carrionii CBS 160.54]ETI25130.1 hypothetical protein G647_04502 [Cladophialophora carrionii CBS 160.54]